VHAAQDLPATKATAAPAKRTKKLTALQRAALEALEQFEAEVCLRGSACGAAARAQS